MTAAPPRSHPPATACRCPCIACAADREHDGFCDCTCCPDPACDGGAGCRCLKVSNDGRPGARRRRLEGAG